MTSDYELLRQYARAGSQAAFTELVERHLRLVHAAALRLTGDADLAKDVAQQVFTVLARKAQRLGAGTILPAFLYRVTRDLATDFVRREQRRQKREQIAVELMQNPPDTTWHQIAPLLEEAMASLGKLDHDLIVLRFFENQSLKDAGAALGLSDDTAQKRLTRAVEKLRRYFAGRGATVSAGALAASVGGFAAPAAPVGLAATISGGALASAAATTGLGLALLKIGSLANLKVTVATLAVAAGVTIAVVQHRSLVHSRADAAQLRARVAARVTANPRARQSEAETSSQAILACLHQLGLAARVFANSHDERYPTNFEEMKEELSGPLPGGLTTDRFEFVPHGRPVRLEVPKSLVIRERTSRRLADGRWVRAYAAADGSASEEFAADGHFQPFEAQREAQLSAWENQGRRP